MHRSNSNKIFCRILSENKNVNYRNEKREKHNRVQNKNLIEKN